NRRALERRLIQEFTRSKRYGTPVSLMILDVDGLKRINDSQGHAEGDRIIRHVADAIQISLRDSDLGARWGGDEFGIVAPNTSADAAQRSAERLVAAVADEHQPDDGQYASVSVGVATFEPIRDLDMDLDALVRAADAALYVAKASGRN